MKPGDTVTLGANPTIKLGEAMIFFKPHAQVSCVLGENPKADIQLLRNDLYTKLWEALQVEVDFVNSVYAEIGGSENIEQLKLACKKVLSNANVTYEEVAGGKVEGQGEAQAVKKPKIKKGTKLKFKS
jgi:hypothetical protein